MSARAASAAANVVAITVASAVPAGADEQHRACRPALIVPQHLERPRKLVRARIGRRIVKRDHEISFGHSAQATLDGRPGLEIVRERDGAENRRPAGAPTSAAAASHRRHAGFHSYIQRARQAGSPVLDRFEDRGRHGKTRRDRRPTPRRPRGPMRRATAHAAARARARRELSEACRRWSGCITGNAVEIGTVAHQGPSPSPAPASVAGVISSALCRGRCRPQPASRSQLPPLARDQHRGEIGADRLRAVGQRQDALILHGAALDIDRRVTRAPPLRRRGRTLPRLRPTFMITAASVRRRRSTSCSSPNVPGSTAKRIVCPRSSAYWRASSSPTCR